MVKPLIFKGEKRAKKRKAPTAEESAVFSESKSLASKDDTNDVHEDDGWVTAEAATDISGPVVLVLLSSEEPRCIACDANGKVFASELENIVDRDLASAEPHDVRQVWIANKAAGTEEFSFKGHHGRYLSCDKIGVLSANREAISPEESFRCIPSTATAHTFNIQTVRELFLTANDGLKELEIRGDADTISFNTAMRIRMQARFKPKNKSHKEQKVKERISRKDLEDAVGRRLEDGEVRRLKKAKMQGDYHEAILDVRVKGKHDKFG